MAGAGDDSVAATEDQPLTILPGHAARQRQRRRRRHADDHGRDRGHGWDRGPGGWQHRVHAHRNFNGAGSFTYTVSDGNGGTTTATVTVTVASVNDEPQAWRRQRRGDRRSASHDPAGYAARNDSDVDADTLTITGVTSGTGGTVALVGGNIVFTPTANFNGAGSFTYTVSDGNGGHLRLPR
jgi:hypothetical protein